MIPKRLLLCNIYNVIKSIPKLLCPGYGSDGEAPIVKLLGVGID